MYLVIVSTIIIRHRHTIYITTIVSVNLYNINHSNVCIKRFASTIITGMILSMRKIRTRVCTTFSAIEVNYG